MRLLLPLVLFLLLVAGPISAQDAPSDSSTSRRSRFAEPLKRVRAARDRLQRRRDLRRQRNAASDQGQGQPAAGTSFGDEMDKFGADMDAFGQQMERMGENLGRDLGNAFDGGTPNQPPVVPPAPPPPPAGWGWWWLLVVPLLLGLAAVVGFFVMRKRRAAPAVQASPVPPSGPGKNLETQVLGSEAAVPQGTNPRTRATEPVRASPQATQVSTPMAAPAASASPQSTQLSAPPEVAAAARPQATHISAAPDAPPAGPVATAATFAPGAAPAAASEKALPVWLKALLADRLGDRYSGLKPLGSGGMGVVVYAHDDLLTRPVALKVPPPHLATVPEFRARFLREARALAKMAHPNVGRVYDVLDGGPDEVPVMVMEYLEGRDLRALVRAGSATPVQARALLRQIAGGLDAVHASEIIHRDLKLANLMLVGNQVKILDFGLASLDDGSNLTRTGAVGGSLHIMPPEQLRGERVDYRVDLFALAVCAYELFTGELPFQNDDRLRTSVPRASRCRPGLPAELDPVLARGLAPHPEDRPTSAREFVTQIEAVFGAAASG